MEIKAIVFDWGDTVMRDLPFEGAMKSWPFVALIPHIKEVILELRNDYRIVLASNAGDSSTSVIVEALKRVDMDDMFHHVFSSKDLGVEKPDVLFFKAIEKELQLNPEELVMIGNSCKKDMAGAKQAGWSTIWFNENELQNEHCNEADMSIFYMGALTELLYKMKDDEQF